MHQATPTLTGAAARRPLALRAHVALAALLAVLAGLLGQGVPGAAATPATADALTRVVVQARADLGAAAAAVAEHGGRVVEVLAPFRMVVADVPTGAVGAVEADAATGAVTPDVPMRVQSTDDEEVADALAADTSRDTVDAPGGDAGAGVGVVVIDTGIAEHPDLDGRVAARYTLAPGRDTDAHGHGTFMAGLIAAGGEHPGVAPGAHLVSVRVADADGATTLTRVLSGLVVADAARDVHDAPVVLLALSGPTADVPDPIMIVSEMLWARGSTVVVAAGNARDGDRQVGSPGADPYLLTVGATDDAGTAERGDDAVAPFSAYGAASFAPDHERPDLVAPGVRVVGPRVPGSTIAERHPDAAIGEAHLRGSGTSMAAALTAGAAAAVLADDPTLTPDEVKGRLVATAADPTDGGEGWGAGTLDVDDALAAEDTGNGNADLAPLPTPKPGGPPAGRVLAPGQLKQIASDHAPAGWSWAGWSWAGWSWAGWSWAEWEWEGWSWAAGESEWAGWSWADGEWAGWSWAGWSWAGWSWAGWSWADGDWAGWSWADDGWAGWSWAGWSWAAAGWGDTWEDDGTA